MEKGCNNNSWSSFTLFFTSMAFCDDLYSKQLSSFFTKIFKSEAIVEYRDVKKLPIMKKIN